VRGPAGGSLPAAPGLPAALRQLADSLEQGAAPVDGRLRQPLDSPFDPLELLAGLPADTALPRCLLGRNHAGWGSAWDLSLAGPGAIPGAGERAELADLDPHAAGEAFFGCWLPFDAGAEPGSGWRAFAGGRLWLPRLEADGARGRLALNLQGAPPGSGIRSRLAAALRGWRPPAVPGYGPLPVDWRVDPEDGPRWCARAARALGALDGAGGLTKLVLARAWRGHCPSKPDPARLLAARPLGETGWPWWVESGGVAWLGESPEPLGRRKGSLLESLALAGTRPRAADPMADAALGQGLLQNEKERREQEAVAAWLRSQLGPLCAEALQEGELDLLRLPGLQHLARPMRGRLRAGIEEAVWAAALHPTPALAGAPREAALAWLRREEGLDRGLYGGLVGRLGSGGGELHVAIRGLRLAGEELLLCAGAGLVPGSRPEAEWHETEAKLAAIARRFGLELPT
jgi:menaquinone-specific isochorismate synthase